MKEFENIVTKYVSQYKENRSKIERRDTIRLFREEAGEILKDAECYREEVAAAVAHEGRLLHLSVNWTVWRRKRRTKRPPYRTRRRRWKLRLRESDMKRFPARSTDMRGGADASRPPPRYGGL